MKREIIVNELAGLTSEELDRALKIEKIATIAIENERKVQEIDAYNKLTSWRYSEVKTTNWSVLLFAVIVAFILGLAVQYIAQNWSDIVNKDKVVITGIEVESASSNKLFGKKFSGFFCESICFNTVSFSNKAFEESPRFGGKVFNGKLNFLFSVIVLESLFNSLNAEVSKCTDTARA